MKPKWSYSPQIPNLGQNRRFFVPCDLEIWQMTLKNNRAPLLCYSSLVHHFMAICEFKMELQSGNARFGSKLAIFVPCDLEIWRMTLKNNRAPLLFYAISSFVHHLIAICEFKMELQSGNAKFGSKSAIFFCPVWPRNLTDDLEKQYGTSSMLRQALCFIS